MKKKVQTLLIHIFEFYLNQNEQQDNDVNLSILGGTRVFFF